jgi:hypothetical protein
VQSCTERGFPDPEGKKTCVIRMKAPPPAIHAMWMTLTSLYILVKANVRYGSLLTVSRRKRIIHGVTKRRSFDSQISSRPKRTYPRSFGKVRNEKTCGHKSVPLDLMVGCWGRRCIRPGKWMVRGQVVEELIRATFENGCEVVWLKEDHVSAPILSHKITCPPLDKMTYASCGSYTALSVLDLSKI